MKTLEIQTNKRLLIVEGEIEKIIDVQPGFNTGVIEDKKFIAIKGKAKLICKGSELNEEIAKGLVEKVMNNQHYQNYNSKSVVDRWCKTALESFISAIEAQGWFWGQNSLGEPKMSDYGWYASGHPEEDSGWMYEEGEDEYYKAFKKWQEAEAKTFNPDKSLIFEIV